MFLGVVPNGCITQIIRAIDFSIWPDIHVCCSGTFRFERAILEAHQGASLVSNDVSVFSVPLGRYVLGEETPLRFVGELARFEDLLRDRPYLDRLSALMVASDYAKYRTGRPNRFKEAHAAYYHEHFDGLISATSDKLNKVLPKIALKGFFAGDWVQHMRDAIQKGNGVVGFPPFYKCLAPHHRILTADLRWVPCGDLKVGDKILAFDEFPQPGMRCRRWQWATITHSAPAAKECVRVHLANGDAIDCTADHPWLVVSMGTRPAGNGGWVEARELCRPSRAVNRDSHDIHAEVIKALDPWKVGASYDDGWLAGILDGEGSISLAMGNGHGAAKVTIAQAAGPVLDRAASLLRARGFDVTISDTHLGGDGRKAVHQLHVNGGFAGMLKALGTFQPVRLINRLSDDLDIGLQSVRVNRDNGGRVRVIGVEPLGVRDIQTISTSTGTYVGEGYLMHNSGYEKMFEFLDRNIEWDAPGYDLYDPKRLHELVDECKHAGIPYCILSDQKFDDHEVMIEYQDRSHVPHYCYASASHTSFRRLSKAGTPFRYTPVDTTKLTDKTRVEIVETTGDKMMFLKDVYLKKTIKHVMGRANYLVYLDGMLAGGIIYDLSKYGAHDQLYLLSDFSLTGRARLAKLIAKMALSRTLIRPLERRYLWKFRSVFTTAFSHNAVSMKYRGVMELKSRKPAADPALGNMINYEGDCIDDTPEQVYQWWWTQHGRKALGQPDG